MRTITERDHNYLHGVHKGMKSPSSEGISNLIIYGKVYMVLNYFSRSRDRLFNIFFGDFLGCSLIRGFGWF